MGLGHNRPIRTTNYLIDVNLPVDFAISVIEMDAVHRRAVVMVRPARESLVELAAMVSPPISLDKPLVCRTSAKRHQCAATPTMKVDDRRMK